jgi:hypothetical protein
MKRLVALIFVAMLAACATTAPPPGTQVDEQRLVAATAVGATRAAVLAALGPTRSISFDSGAEVWLYQIPRPGGLFAEYVVLFEHGVVSRTRRREPTPVKAQ